MSLLALTNSRESALQATWYTDDIWPLRVLINLPVYPSHTLMWLSKEADTRSYPLGEKETWFMILEWPVSLQIGFLVDSGSQRYKVWSSEPLTSRSCFPSPFASSYRFFATLTWSLLLCSALSLCFGLWSKQAVLRTYSVDKAKLLTQWAWDFKSRSSLPSFALHSLTLRSCEPE